MQTHAQIVQIPAQVQSLNAVQFEVQLIEGEVFVLRDVRPGLCQFFETLADRDPFLRDRVPDMRQFLSEVFERPQLPKAIRD